MDRIAVEGIRLLFSEEGAGWIVAALLGFSCLHLYRETVRSQEARIGDAGATATALERASQANSAVALAIESRTRVLEDLSRLASEISRGVDRSDERAREKFDEILRRLSEPRHEGR
ncbi:hypothetical protein [Methylobacterium sp. 77]|uniref:hypothetical protein n=1 Tax=Methylobacterium sp. 77 TaxID=1101192 RepID=UPI0003714D65|nr:hypothetical protein [Methylobacterium sp. 77]